MSAPARLLVLGTGGIAWRHAEQFGALSDCRLAAAVDLDEERARQYAQAHGIAEVFADLDAALAWNGFDAAINATPDAVHAPTTLKLLAAGKPVFCEKPLALHGEDARAMADAAEQAGLVNFVNFTYRNAHALQYARRLVDAGEIGAVRHVEASYLQSWLSAKHWGDWRVEERWLWRLSKAHGSNGVLGDIGVHLLDFVAFGTGLDITRLIARLRTFSKAEGDRIGAYKLDANDSVAISAELANGALAAIHMSRFATGNLNDLNLAIYGDRGALRIWANHLDSRLEGCLGVDIETQSWKAIACPPTPRNEARFLSWLRGGAPEEPSFRTAAGVQHLLDLCTRSDEQGAWLNAG